MAQGQDFPRSSYLGESGGKRRAARLRKSAPLPGALPAESGNGQRVMDAPCGSPAAAGIPREFPGRETCSPGGRATEECGPHPFTEESGNPRLRITARSPGTRAPELPRSHSGLTRATVPPASVSTVTEWRQLPAPLLIISLSGINIRI